MTGTPSTKINTDTLPIHPAADTLPPMDDVTYANLVGDIKANGLIDPITTHKGAILDGRHRYRACLEAGVEPRFEARDDISCPMEYVVRTNLHRRHLTPSQKAMLAQDALPMMEAEARERQRQAGELPEKIPEADKGEAREKVARLFGVNPRYISDAKQIKADHAELAEEVRSGTKTIAQAKRQIREQDRDQRREANRTLVAQTSDPKELLGKARFATVVIDPPWDWGEGPAGDLFGKARPGYATMPIEDIQNLPVGELADEDSHAYLWVANQFINKGIQLLEGWGFRYVTCLTWCKPGLGLGHYYRNSTEHVLFGIKGSQELARRDVGTWFQWPRPERKHSTKPPEFFDLVESASPGPRLEMFAREKRDRWTSWGAEVPPADSPVKEAV